MKKSGRKFSLMELSLVGILLAMFVIFSILNGPSFFGAYNLLNILKQISIYVIIGFGVTWTQEMSTPRFNINKPPMEWM